MDELLDYFDFDGDGHLSCLELAFAYDALFGEDESPPDDDPEDD